MHVLIVDDEESIRKTTALALESMGHDAATAEGGTTACRMLDASQFEVVFLDLKLGGESGLDLLPEMLKRAPQLSIVVFTAFASVETAVEAMRRGAVDYIPKPFTPEQIRQVVARILDNRRLQGRVADLESRLHADAPEAVLETREPSMQRAYDILHKAASAPASILLLGESGSGKTVIARLVHERSPQRENAFVTISCPSLNRELLESELFGHVKGAFTGALANTWGKVALADGGTLFLDEIGEVPIEVQPKLLRLLQEREYERVGETKTHRANVRVVAATNRDLEKAVREGRFREDLFYRLNVISVRLPALRERIADLMAIARSYLRFFAMQCGKHLARFTPAAESAMMGYHWPGNLRELRNAVERAVILAAGNEIDLEDLPDSLREGPGQAAEAGVRMGALVSLDKVAEEHIRRVLTATESLGEAARILGIDPATLYRKRRKLAL